MQLWNPRRWSIAAPGLLLALLFLAAPSSAHAQYTLVSSVVAGGGVGIITASPYTFGGTTGQAEADAPWVGSPYALNGGFWHIVEVTTPVELLSFEVE